MIDREKRIKRHGNASHQMHASNDEYVVIRTRIFIFIIDKAKGIIAYVLYELWGNTAM